MDNVVLDLFKQKFGRCQLMSGGKQVGVSQFCPVETVQMCIRDRGICCYRGDENNVLDRFVQAAAEFNPICPALRAISRFLPFASPCLQVYTPLLPDRPGRISYPGRSGPPCTNSQSTKAYSKTAKARPPARNSLSSGSHSSISLNGPRQIAPKADRKKQAASVAQFVQGRRPIPYQRSDAG